MATESEEALLTGLLIGEGHFGGDGRQPQVTLRMHVRHEKLFRWIDRSFPGGRLYGPYHHGGRDYYQWMARGPFLRQELVPMLLRRLSPELDEHSFGRFLQMCERYDLSVAAENSDPLPAMPTPVEPSVSVDSASSTRSAGERAASLSEIFSKLRTPSG